MSYHPTFYGTSLDGALWRACQALERDPAAIEYRLARIADGRVKLEVLNAPMLEGEAPEPEPYTPPETASKGSSAPEPVAVPAGEVPEVPAHLETPELAMAVLQELLGRMQLSVETRLEVRPEAIHVALHTAEEDVLLGNDARVLDSLQYLLNRIVQHHRRGDAPPIVLDVGGRRERRAEEVASMARRLADRVAHHHQAVYVLGATSADRRAIHHAISERRDVRSESEGVGAFRVLTVKPA